MPDRSFLKRRHKGACCPLPCWRPAIARHFLGTTAILLALGLSQAAFAEAEAVRHLAPSIRASDILALRARCGPADPIEESYELTRRCAFAGPPFGEDGLLAFEENRFFIYAVGEAPQGESTKESPADEEASSLVRRFVFLKPSTFLFDDRIRTAGPQELMRWRVDSEYPIEVTGDPAESADHGIRIAYPDGDLLWETLLPRPVTYQSLGPTRRSPEIPGPKPGEHHIWATPRDAAAPVRFVHLLHFRGAGQKESVAKAELVEREGQLEVTVSTPDRTFRLRLPPVSAGAGEIEVAKADGETLLGRRLLPSGVLPHGPEGVGLLERWDSRYRGQRRPGWDTGRPSSELKKAVQEGTLRPCRAVVLGCGSGTNAVYLAGQGFDVTGIDIAPTALNQCIQKAKKAEVRVRWMLADVLAPPPLEPFDLIYDRGCYHGVRRQNAAGYVEAVRRLSRPGTRVLILAGNANDPGRGGGPPKVKEEEIRADFSSSFEFEWLRETRFDTFEPEGTGALAWSVLLRRKPEP